MKVFQIFQKPFPWLWNNCSRTGMVYLLAIHSDNINISLEIVPITFIESGAKYKLSQQQHLLYV